MPFRIFVSSTFVDLREERAAVARVLQGLQNIYVGMEFFGPHNEPPLETSLREVANSNLYLGIFGERYGTLAPSSGSAQAPVTGKSITELEYHKARELKLSCAIFFRDRAFVPNDDIHRETDPVKQEKLQELKKELERNHTPAWFKTADDLATQVALYLPRMMMGLYAQTKGIPPPRPPEYFVGREIELTELNNRLTRHGLTVVAGVRGMGGIGKTVLAQAFAFRYAAEFSDGIFWLPLAGRDPNIVLQDLARALGADVGKYTDVETRAGAVRALLTGKRSLVVYDDVTDTDIKHLPTLRMPCAIILTTRLTHLPGIDPREMFELGTLTENDALVLCREILGTARVNAELKGARELCKAAGFLPLALTIALRVLYNNQYETLREYAAHLRNQTRVLKELARGETKDLNVRASFDLSYATLSEEDKRRYRRLAVFASGEFEVDLVAQIVENIPRSNLLERLVPSLFTRPRDETIQDTNNALERFVDRALLTRIERARCRLHPLLKAYAGEHLLEAGEDVVVWKQAAGIYRKFSQLNSGHNNWNVLEKERENVLGILDWCLKSREDSLLAEITECNHKSWYFHGHWDEQIRWLELAVEARRKLGDRENQAKNMGDLAVTLMRRGQTFRATKLLRESLVLYRELGNSIGIATTLHNLGSIAAEQHYYSTARALFQESLTLKRKLGDLRGAAVTMHEVGRIAANQGDFVTACDMLQQSLQIENELGDEYGSAASLRELGRIKAKQGDYPTARELCHQSLTLSKQLGEKQGIAVSLYALGAILLHQGEHSESNRMFQESLFLAEELGDSRAIAANCYGLAQCALDQGDFLTTKDLFKKALAIKQELDDKQASATISRLLIALEVLCRKFAENDAKIREGLRILKGWIEPDDYSFIRFEVRQAIQAADEWKLAIIRAVDEEQRVPERAAARRLLEAIHEVTKKMGEQLCMPQSEQEWSILEAEIEKVEKEKRARFERERKALEITEKLELRALEIAEILGKSGSSMIIDREILQTLRRMANGK